MFLLDTAAVSEFSKPASNKGLNDWLSTVDWNDLFISAITVAELWNGIAGLPQGQRRRALEAWFDLITDRFEGRILPVDFEIAVEFGEIQARSGPIPLFDALIGATALVNHYTVVTRNTADLARTGAAILDPWT